MMLIRPLVLATPLFASIALVSGDKSQAQAPAATETNPQTIVAQRRQILTDAAALPPSPTADAQARARNFEAIHMAILKQRQADKELTIREINHLQTRHHETMMQIIRNIGPSGRYEYNPATGRYDRYQPNLQR